VAAVAAAACQNLVPLQIEIRVRILKGADLLDSEIYAAAGQHGSRICGEQAAHVPQRRCVQLHQAAGSDPLGRVRGQRDGAAVRERGDRRGLGGAGCRG
jgi:hypothetical protein